MAEEKIINRIKKMMALANDKAASDGERENAIRMSYALMAKYNLDASDVEGKPVGPQESRSGMEGEFYSRPWAIRVCADVAKLFFCQYYRRSTGKNDAIHTFTGKESNAATALEVARVLVESIRREAGIQMRAKNQNVTWRRSFATGASLKIHERVEELISSKVDGLSAGTSLVLVNLRKTEEQANQLFIAQQGITLRVRNVKASQNLHADAYYSGRAFGSGLNLNASKKIS